ncbi:acetate non-utilizing protein 9 [Dissophora globulifera]|nr:acetate non-utilizing protein 9 [Dissophora globulifera]
MASQKTLIPPLQLYRQILRAHRVHLPPQFRILGDGYVKAEFHRHKDIDNPLYIVGFIEQWQDYLNHILSSANANAATRSSSPTISPAASAASPTARATATTSSDATRESTLQQIVAQGQAFGKKIDPALLDKMTDQQLGQLYELRKETKGLQTPQELDELAKEEAQLLEKAAATIPASTPSSASTSSPQA